MNERGPLYRGPLGHLRGERRRARAGGRGTRRLRRRASSKLLVEDLLGRLLAAPVPEVGAVGRHEVRLGRLLGRGLGEALLGLLAHLLPRGLELVLARVHEVLEDLLGGLLARPAADVGAGGGGAPPEGGGARRDRHGPDAGPGAGALNEHGG